MPRATQTRQAGLRCPENPTASHGDRSHGLRSRLWDTFAAAGPSPGVSAALGATAADSSRPDCDIARDAERRAEVKPQAVEARTMAQAPDAGSALPSESWDIPAALDAAISGPVNKDRACIKALLFPEARMMCALVGADRTPTYRLQTLDDRISRPRARDHIVLEEKQLSFRIGRCGAMAHLWGLYALHGDGKAVACGINSIQAIKEAGGRRIAGVTAQAESAAAPLPEEYLP